MIKFKLERCSLTLLTRYLHFHLNFLTIGYEFQALHVLSHPTPMLLAWRSAFLLFMCAHIRGSVFCCPDCSWCLCSQHSVLTVSVTQLSPPWSSRVGSEVLPAVLLCPMSLFLLFFIISRKKRKVGIPKLRHEDELRLY